MATVTFRGSPIHTSGDLPKVGTRAPDFQLTAGDFSDKSLKDFAGKRKVLNIVPTLDTNVCATSARKFNESAGKLPDTAVLVISCDLPLASKRFCTTEGLENVTPLSLLRSKDFARDYGILLVEGPWAGLTGRAVVVVDEKDQVTYTELVPNIGQEPNYDAALAALKR